MKPDEEALIKRFYQERIVKDNLYMDSFEELPDSYKEYLRGTLVYAGFRVGHSFDVFVDALLKGFGIKKG